MAGFAEVLLSSSIFWFCVCSLCAFTQYEVTAKGKLSGSLVAELSAAHQLKITGHMGGSTFLVLALPTAIDSLSLDHRVSVVKPRTEKYVSRRTSKRQSRGQFTSNAAESSSSSLTSELVVSLVDIELSQEVSKIQI